MRREIYSKLLLWKNNPNRKPLIITGARQVGKTWIMREFGKNEYEEVVYINCDNESRMEKLLSDDYNIDRILLGLQAISGINIKENKTKATKKNPWHILTLFTDSLCINKITDNNIVDCVKYF